MGEALIDSGIETVVLQAGVVIGSGSASFEMIRHLTERLPVMTTPKWVHNRIQPIAVRDALHYLVAAASAEVPGTQRARTWDIGGPDVLEYGDMMRVYADVAGLHRRYIFVLPFLTPSIASLWVGTVTPIPSGLARPLIESLECDAVMGNSDIDTIIDPPPGGLTPYRRAVSLALNRGAQGLPDAGRPSLQREPAEPLPSDPDWAGEVVYTDLRIASTAAGPEQVWAAACNAANNDARWQVAECKPGTTLRLCSRRRTRGTAWLEMTVTPQDGGSRYTQRAIFVPAGLRGRLYWFLARPLHIVALAALARNVIGTSE
ncbi:hypothetical protein ATCCBAA256_12250 [Mycobacterium montefiorense]|nr:hypothetical protein ATCCBAA256_12250 [Mycobacterium montefiorense]